MTLDVWRDGKTIQKQVKLRERPLTKGQQDPTAGPRGTAASTGWASSTRTSRASFRSSHGIPGEHRGIVVTSVTPTSPLYEQLVRPGNVITEVNGQPVKGTADFESAIKSAKPGSYVRLYALQFGPRGEQPPPFFAVVQVPAEAVIPVDR